MISHDHELPIPKVVGIPVVLVVLETKNLLDVLNLLVLHDLVVLRVADVEKLSTQWEDTIVVPTNDTQSSNCKRLGGVSFRQDKRTVAGLPSTGIIGIRQLWKTLKPTRSLVVNSTPKKEALPVTPFAVSLLELLVRLTIRPIENLVNDGGLLD